MATNISHPLQQASTPDSPQPIANAWHTLGLFAAVLGLSFAGAQRIAASASRPHGRLILYAGTIIVDWVIVGYIWMGVKRRGVRLRDLTGGKWRSGEDFVLDVFIAVCFWIVSSLILAATKLAVGLATLDPAKTLGQVSELKKTLGFIVPQGPLEVAGYVALTVTAGFCEELLYRGYFQQQFRAWTKNVTLAIVAQGVLFGASHGYQGWRFMSLIALYGCLFGIMAVWRKSLRPGMMAHAWQDLFSGIVLKLATRFAP
jgi:membrane protease YdiL (CAAX protease family)